MADRPTGVVLLNMGGPDSQDAVEPFLFNLFNDNDIIPLPLGGLWLGQRLLARAISSRRARHVRGYYQLIGGRSPIAEITRAQADALERRLGAVSPGAFKCYVAMRYWHPFTDEALDQMQRDGVGRVVALTLYPHYTTATTGSSLFELYRRLAARKPPGLGAVEVTSIDRFFDDPAYLDALAEQVRAGLAQFAEGEPPLILFSAHGLPVSFIHKGDPYVEHLYATIAGVTARLAAASGRVPAWRLSFQSRAGRARWLEPATDEALRTLAREGRRDVLIVPISFVSDHIETLYEIDLLFGGEARKLGLNMKRAPSLNASPRFIDALAGLVERKLGIASPRVEPASARSAARIEPIRA
jgi:protoporphyrin/coproporphyrin ferrochelatase